METVKQKTLKGSFSLFGKGLHTGLSLTVTFNPAPENTGYKIQRIDLEGQPVIDAVAENVVDTQRGTVLAKGEARVSTIEHGMSALYAMGIDNCLIQINGPEFPILDGSATMYVDKINEVGIVDQNAPKDYYIIRKKIEIKERFIEVEETHDSILAIHGRNSFHADIQEMRKTVTKNILLHVTRLRSLGGGRNTSARTKLTHENTIAISFKISDWVQNTIDAHTNADIVTQIFDVNIGSPELVRLIEQEIKDFISTDRIESLRDRSKSFGITIAGNSDVVIMNLPWRIIAEHENLIGAV